jgi:hypothetical protein
MKRQNLSIFNFKKFVIAVFIPFMVIGLFLGACINYFFSQKIILGSQISGAYKVNRIISENNLNEIPFLGSSRAVGTFIPDSLVKNGFNYGLHGAQDDVMLFFLKEECQKKGKTTPIILNFDLDGLNCLLGDMSNYLYNSDYTPIKHLIKKRYKAIYEVPFLKYYGSFELYTKYYLNNILNLTTFTNNGASIEKYDELKTVLAPKHEVKFHNSPEIQRDLLQTISENPNRRFIFIVNPYHHDYLELISNIQEAEQFLDFLKNIKNVRVLNFSRLNYPDSYFHDITHLNLTGAVVYNRMLKDSLGKYVKD